MLATQSKKKLGSLCGTSLWTGFEVTAISTSISYYYCMSVTFTQLIIIIILIFSRRLLTQKIISLRDNS